MMEVVAVAQEYNQNLQNGTELKALIAENVQTKSQYTSYVSTGGLIDAYESIKATVTNNDCLTDFRD